MKKIALCLLAYGEEHIKESGYLIDSLSKYKDIVDFYVGSDQVDGVSKNANVIKISDSFNFNLKRISINEALKHSDIMIFMDTDNYVINDSIDFSFLNNIKDGIYFYWLDKNVEYMQEKISIDGLLNGKSKSSINNEYMRKLYELNDTKKDLFFVDERIFIIKLEDKKKKEDFISHWNYIFEKTLYTQPNNGNVGAMEGLIIYLACIKSDIDIYNNDDKNVIHFFKNFYHYNKEKNKEKIFNIKNII